jgi:hypothetical protein
MLDAFCFNSVTRSSSTGTAPYSDLYLRMVIDIWDERGICVGTGYLDRIPGHTSTRCMAVVVAHRVELSLGHTPITYFLLVKETADKVYGHVLNTLDLKPAYKRKVILVFLCTICLLKGCLILMLYYLYSQRSLLRPVTTKPPALQPASCSCSPPHSQYRSSSPFYHLPPTPQPK